MLKGGGSVYFRKMAAPALQRVTVSSFPGLDRRVGAAKGSAWEMTNLCAEGFPALQVRRRRGTVAQLAAPGGLTAKEALLWVDGRTLYVAGYPTGLVLREGEKQFVSMGAYLVIFPDKVWINLRDLDSFGSLENRVSTTAAVSLSLCRPDGQGFGAYTVSDLAPQEPGEGALWLDGGVSAAVLRRYTQDGWEDVADVCVKLQSAGIGAGFQSGDGVEITGCAEPALNGRHVLRAVEGDALVISGTVGGDGVQEGSVTVARTVPDMDYVVQCGNRLWGCKYGMADGRAVNEIYASKLGDFCNWQCYEGLSTDSYAASRGSDGPFTGAAGFLGGVLFFKENCIERIYPSAAGAHQIVTVECPGVLSGCGKSIAQVDGTLYWLGRGGVYAFDGSLPVPVSQALGAEELTGGVAGAWQGGYYLSAAGEEGGHHLFVYDTRRGVWHRQDALDVLDFAAWNGELYALSREGTLLALHGAEGTAESAVLWQAESGELGLATAEHRYPMRLSLSLAPEAGSRVEASLSYDGGRTWQKGGALTGRGDAETVTLHLRPRRCAHLRLRLQGSGGCTVYSVSAVYGKGSDET